MNITFSLRHTRDSFRKIVLIEGFSLPWTDSDGVTYMGGRTISS